MNGKMIESLYPDFFSTFFMFPFRIEHHIELSKYISGLFKKGWQKKSHKIQKGIDYNEYVYFYPYIWDILFKKEDSENKGSKLEGVTFLRYDLPEDENYFSVDVMIREEKGVKLPLKNIFLHLFEIGVGILVFEVVYDLRFMSNKNELYSVEDYLRFMETGRRIFVPFVNAKEEINLESKNYLNSHTLKKPIENGLSKDGIVAALDAVSKGNMPEKVEIKLGGESITTDFINAPLLLENAGMYKPALGPIITHFLDTEKFNYQNNAYKPIIDERMFVHAYFSIPDSVKFFENKIKKTLPSSNYNFLRLLKIAFKNGIQSLQINDATKLWYQMIFLDWNGPSCQNPYMMRKLLDGSTYLRWSDYGTLTGFSRFSSVMISNINEAGYLYNHFQSMYYQIAILLLFYRGSILSFSDRSEKISDLINNLPKGIAKSKEDKDKLIEIRNEVDQLRKNFLLFRNKFWFREVTAQDQGIEIFDLWSKQMRNMDLMQDVQSEIKELFDFVDSTYEKDVSKTVNILTVLGAVAIPLAIITSFFGMNLPFITNLMNEDLNISVKYILNRIIATFSSTKIILYVVSFLIFLIAFALLYWIIRKIFYFYEENELIHFPKIRDLMKAIFKRRK